MTHAVVGLGSNLGDRIGNLRAAVAMLHERGLTVTAKSSAWESEPVPAGQPAFLNAVVAGETDLEPLALLNMLKAIEYQLGRRAERRWGPRPIDLDILFLGEGRLSLRTLRVPHERILERNFVLAPLAEVDRGPMPVFGVTALEALRQAGTAGLRRVGEL